MWCVSTSLAAELLKVLPENCKYFESTSCVLGCVESGKYQINSDCFHTRLSSAQQDQQAVVGNNEQAVTINIVSHSLIILSITFIISLSANTDAVIQIGLFSS